MDGVCRFATARVHLPDLVDYQFTAEMEDELDAISRGEMNPVDYLRNFYFGNEHPGLKKLLANKIDEIDAREVCRILLGRPEARGEEIFIRVGKYGPFLEQGERRASLPDKLPPDELTLASAVEMLDNAGQGDEPLGICPDTHKPVFVKTGAFRPLRAARHGRRRRKTAKRLAAERHGSRKTSISTIALKLLVPAAHAGQSSAHAESRRSVQRPVRPLREVRRGHPFAARGIFAARCDLERGIAVIGQRKIVRCAAVKKPVKRRELYGQCAADEGRYLRGTGDQRLVPPSRGTTLEEVQLRVRPQSCQRNWPCQEISAKKVLPKNYCESWKEGPPARAETRKKAAKKPLTLDCAKALRDPKPTRLPIGWGTPAGSGVDEDADDAQENFSPA